MKLIQIRGPTEWCAVECIAVDWYDGPTCGALKAPRGWAWFRLLDERFNVSGLNRRLFGLHPISESDYEALAAGVQFLGPNKVLGAIVWRPDGSAEWQNLERLVTQLDANTEPRVLLISSDFQEVEKAWEVEGRLLEEHWASLLD